MIGTFTTVDENGQGLVVRFRRVDGKVTLLSVTDRAGKDQMPDLSHSLTSQILEIAVAY